MRKITGMVLVILVLAAAALGKENQAPAPDSSASQIRVMSYNIRCLNLENDFQDLWWLRKKYLAGLIRKNQPDLIGMQEVYTLQADDLAQALAGYAWFGPPRDDGRKKGERCPIFYRKDRVELLEQNTFWLSETPDIPGSISWDAACRRVVTWGKFQDRRSGKIFFQFNTHFDHKGEIAREKSGRLLTQKIQQIAGQNPVFVTGDFNTAPESAPYRTINSLLLDSRKIAQVPPRGPHNTAWDFQPGNPPTERIDYVFVSTGIAVKEYLALDQTYRNDRRPSDHIPVLVTIIIP